MKNVFLVLGLGLTVSSFAQLKVYNNGSISLGSITAPPWNFKVQVIGNTIFSATTGAITASPYIRGVNTYTTAGTPDFTWYNNDATGIFHPASNSLGISTAGSERMRFFANGNIGVTNYGVDEGSRFYIYLDPNTNITALGFRTNYSIDYLRASISYVNRSTTKSWVVQNGATETFYVTGGGLVTAVALTTTSDETLKNDIKPISSPLKKVLALSGYSYVYTPAEFNISGSSDNSTPKRQIGFMAQNVEQIVPEVVFQNDKGLKSIAYGNLVALLVEAMKEQNQQIMDMQAQQEKLHVLIDSLTQGKNSLGQSKNYLLQNAPNPFSAKTTIGYNVSSVNSKAQIMIFNMQGTLVKTYPISTGKGELEIQGSELQAGMYLYTLVVDNQEVETKRMILTK